MLVFLATFAIGAAGSGWYGPVSVAFPSSVTGNPHDPAVNDARIRFTGPDSTERLAYWKEGAWRTQFTTRKPGTYTARLTVNGKASGEALTVNVPASSLMRDGYIRIERSTQRFVYDSGRGYFPLGTNLAWSNEAVPDLALRLREMGAAGMNWARIWANHWDNKNPMWTRRDGKPTPGVVDESSLAKWDGIVAAAAEAGVPFQFVFFHHGPYSSTVNSNWGEHPWNRANGGFLDRPNDFFTNPTAKRLTKQWLRIAVARWGHSTGIMAWELFNEVEWCDESRANPASVAAWHREMTAYLKSIDPVGRLVTTSSAMEQPGLYDAADFYQPHSYPPDVAVDVISAHVPKDKPFFYGEVGLAGGPQDPVVERKTVRDSIWSGVVAAHAGAAQYWYWDWLARHDEFPQFARADRILREAAWADRRTAKRLNATLDAGSGADLRLVPGAGWGKAEQMSFALPEQAGAVGRVPRYFQSQKGPHAAMFEGPLMLNFRAERAGKVRVSLAEISAAGAEIVLRVNGVERARQAFPKSEANRGTTAVLDVDYPAGPVRVELENVGADWVVFKNITVTGLGPRALVHGAGDPRLNLLRVTRATGATGTISGSLSGLTLPNGPVTLRIFDLDRDAVREVRTTVQGGKTAQPLTLTESDAIVLVRP